MAKPKLVVITGPTASGKTAAAIELAESLQGEIISADSRQVYRKLDIGTAKPSAAELVRVPHHLIDCKHPDEPYTAGQFARDASLHIERLQASNNVPVVVGGTGLYISALLEPLHPMPADETLKKELQALYKDGGIAALRERLEATDPAYAQGSERDNPHRLMRAIEITQLSGKTLAEWHRSNRAERPYESLIFILQPPREELYARIDKRVDHMFAQGLLQEATSLLPYRHCKALCTVGYSEIFQFLDGELSLDQTVENIKRNTRRYAKRQVTWMKRYSSAQVLQMADTEAMLRLTKNFLSR